MNKDLELFTKVMNHLIYLTTRDEYGSSRSKGIETLSDLAAELNSENISAHRGEWSENALKIQISRIKRRYSLEEIKAELDLELIDRCAWEYSSGTTHESVARKKKCSSRMTNQKTPQAYPIITYMPIDGELWKEHELSQIVCEEKKSIRILKKIKRLDT